MENINFLNLDNIRFFRSDTGILNIDLKGNIYNNVKLLYLFPFSFPNGFISILDEKNNEIGIIKNLLEFNKSQQDIIKEEIHRRYIIPKIKDIFSIKREYGTFEWNVDTDKGKKKFFVKGRDENIIVKDEKILITDINGCIYEINNFRRLSKKSLLQLEKVL